MHPFSWSNLIRFLLVIVMGVFYCRVTGEMVLSSKNQALSLLGLGNVCRIAARNCSCIGEDVRTTSN